MCLLMSPLTGSSCVLRNAWVRPHLGCLSQLEHSIPIQTLNEQMDDYMIRRRDYNTVFRKWTNRSRMSRSLQTHSECSSGPITPSDQLNIPEFPDYPQGLKHVHKNISTPWWQAVSLLAHDLAVEVTSITCTPRSFHSSPNS